MLLRERAKTGRISFKDFYMRRALRIFPVYYLTVLVCYFIFRLGPAHTLSLLTYTFNFYHPLHAVPNPLEHTWSLSVEERFRWPHQLQPRGEAVVIGLGDARVVMGVVGSGRAKPVCRDHVAKGES
ncbi:hypothetical protein [Tardiphaga sp. 42S5]|uniref:hypothetical protein n=1 Tax=unclassified Tardiphaga TaxID=2631404 RepID=UPI002A5A36CA|nr:hypothetical protein [Tardiphaga sp. 42S5]WPO44240.1 hypothetical protein SFY93_14285 [Tardiphaga sp. 42S5]